MARWRLTDKHYLNGHFPGEERNEWEYRETDRTTGRMGRKTFVVPMYLDPDERGETIVCHEGKGRPQDIVFVGPPTPEMEPLDDEAQAITDKEKVKWIHPVESLSGNYSQSLIETFQKQIDAIASGRAINPVAAAPTGGVSKEEFEALQAQVAALMARNLELEASVPDRRA